MSGIVIVCNNRAERGPLESVIAALPEARVVGVDVAGLPPAAAMAYALTEFTGRLAGARLVIVLGDRYETLAAALAAMFLRIPVAHIHGGETTTGAFDDALRDSITAIASLHFPATFKAQGRIRELRPDTSTYSMCMAGAPGLDGIPRGSALRDRKLVLVTYHPETRAADYGAAGCRAMLAALPLGYEIIFCGVNTDPGGAEIQRIIDDWRSRRGGAYMPGLSHRDYIAMMQHAELCIGNSSSLVIECPWVGCPSVLVGNRQDGREYADSIFQCDEDIGAAIKDALAYTGIGASDPIYQGGAAPQIAAACREFVK
jgi:UDP-hydrolysing UDP-N-acetyl-D-glucosamine 2-epimerase